MCACFTDGFGAMKLILNYESICNEKMGSIFFVFLVFVSCLFFVYHNRGNSLENWRKK